MVDISLFTPKAIFRQAPGGRVLAEIVLRICLSQALS
jgi:hypothetical protein